MAFDSILRVLNMCLRFSRTVCDSESLSAMMSLAPARASSTEATFSPTYFLASASGSVTSTFHILSAKGSRPFSFAIVARVLLFGLYGR